MSSSHLVSQSRQYCCEMDYSEAGRNVLADLVTKHGGQWWDHGVIVMDMLHHDEVTGGCLYVGGWQAAEDLALLQSKRITHVINCTTDLQCPHTKDISYHTFDIRFTAASLSILS